MIKIKRTIQIQPLGSRSRPKAQLPAVTPGRIPRISRLMALAIKFEGLLNEGVIADQTELAKLAHVTQPRIAQIMNLLNLAPDIQEQLLFLPRVMHGKDRIHEKMLRPMTRVVSWEKQREMWREWVRGFAPATVERSNR